MAGNTAFLLNKINMQKIVIPAVPHKLREYVKDGEEVIELFDTYFRMSGRARVKEPDDKTELITEQSYDYDIYVDKLSVTSIKIVYNNEIGKYQLSIIHTGILETIMPNRTMGEEILTKLCDWRWNQ